MTNLILESQKESSLDLLIVDTFADKNITLFVTDSKSKDATSSNNPADSQRHGVPVRAELCSPRLGS